MELRFARVCRLNFLAIAFAFQGCATPPRTEEPTFDLASLGVQVCDDRNIPELYVPINELDAPPLIRPCGIVDRFEDEIEEALRLAGEQQVEIVLLVSETGTVDDVIVRKAQFAYFAERARAEARRLRFNPAYRSGLPTKWHVNQTIRFTRQERGKRANQALQTTPMARTVSEKTIEFGHPQRGV